MFVDRVLTASLTAELPSWFPSCFPSWHPGASGRLGPVETAHDEADHLGRGIGFSQVGTEAARLDVAVRGGEDDPHGLLPGAGETGGLRAAWRPRQVEGDEQE